MLGSKLFKKLIPQISLFDSPLLLHPYLSTAVHSVPPGPFFPPSSIPSQFPSTSPHRKHLSLTDIARAFSSLLAQKWKEKLDAKKQKHFPAEESGMQKRITGQPRVTASHTQTQPRLGLLFFDFFFPLFVFILFGSRSCYCWWDFLQFSHFFLVILPSYLSINVLSFSFSFITLHSRSVAITDPRYY